MTTMRELANAVARSWSRWEVISKNPLGVAPSVEWLPKLRIDAEPADLRRIIEQSARSSEWFGAIARKLNEQTKEQTKEQIDEFARRIHLRVLHDQYLVEPNPICAWETLVICSERGEALPEWVSNYLARAGKEILAMETGGVGSRDLRPGVYAALEFKGDPFARRAEMRKRVRATWRVFELVEEDERAGKPITKEEPYYTQVAEEYGTSPATVRRWVEDLGEIARSL